MRQTPRPCRPIRRCRKWCRAQADAGRRRTAFPHGGDCRFRPSTRGTCRTNSTPPTQSHTPSPSSCESARISRQRRAPTPRPCRAFSMIRARNSRWRASPSSCRHTNSRRSRGCQCRKAARRPSRRTPYPKSPSSIRARSKAPSRSSRLESPRRLRRAA